MTLIDRAALREKVNKLYATATAEQQKILLGVCELIESAPSYRDKKGSITVSLGQWLYITDSFGNINAGRIQRVYAETDFCANKLLILPKCGNYLTRDEAVGSVYEDMQNRKIMNNGVLPKIFLHDSKESIRKSLDDYMQYREEMENNVS